jgi:ATP-binding cassette subfamily B protein
VLCHLDLELRPGEVVALVGVNGAGKTTLGKLLGGLYRPDTGRVSVDGGDLAALDMAAWRRRLAVVPQDFVHYPATLRDNVALSAPEHPADDGPVLAALRASGAAGLAAGLPEGLDTWLRSGGANGAELSGGQWQKVALARAVFAAAHGRRVLVFDEPTAHLDIAAEAEFHRQVIGAVTDTSVLLISHRLSTVRHADRIVLLDGGRISEAGTHDQLLRDEGEYARLFALQAARFAQSAGPRAVREGR